MGFRRLGLFGSVLVLLALTSAARAVEPGDLSLTVTPERSGKGQPFAREMVLLKLRGVYRTQILLEDVHQPALVNFSWTQLGRDSWGRTRLPDGQMALLFERTIAIFPQHTGSFTIDPFIHKLTINDNGERKQIDVPSEPLPFPVASWTAESGGPDAPEPWWLPARDVTITDSWDPDPESIKVGETTRRIVTLEAQGMLAEGLPPRPIMRTRGIVTFAGPVKRETLITPSGPVARATYQWDIKPGVKEVISLDAVKIPWFDTDTRTMREAEIPARQIGGGTLDREDDLKPSTPVSWTSIAVVGLVASASAFGLGLALIGYGSGTESLRLGVSKRRELNRAARTNDAICFRTELAQVERDQPELAACWRTSPDTILGLTGLDRHIYGNGAIPDLTALARAFGRLHRPAAKQLAHKTRLADLDGFR